MNNIILNLEKLTERRAKHLAREKRYRHEISPVSNVSIFCTHHYVTKFELFDILHQLF